MDPEKEVEKAVDRFPFVMVLSSTVLKGSVFVMINAPLLLVWLERKAVTSLSSLIKDEILRLWITAVQSAGNFVTFSAFLVMSLVVGTFLTPLERLFTFITVLAASKLKALLGRRTAHLQFFSSAEMAASDYAQFLSWLFTEPSYKAHWEWELFNFYNFWSIFTNISIFALLVILILGGTLSPIELIGGAIFVTMTLAFALFHSSLMGKVHKLYKQKFLSSKAHSKFPPLSGDRQPLLQTQPIPAGSERCNDK